MPAPVAKLLIALVFLSLTLLPAFAMACLLCWATGHEKASLALFFLALILFTAIALDRYANIIWDMQPGMQRPVELDEPLPVYSPIVIPRWLVSSYDPVGAYPLGENALYGSTKAKRGPSSLSSSEDHRPR